MCTMSMIYDHYHDKWKDYVRPVLPYIPYVPPISPEEVADFRKLLERARQYDREHNQPDCELEEKKQKLRKLAEELGVDIDFPEAVREA